MTQPPHAAVDQPGKTRIAFIDIGRSLAALLVVYSHIPARVEGESTPALSAVETYVSEPLHLQLQGPGQVAVPFFFLVSGFIVTPIALQQGIRRFFVNRLIRIYLPIAFVLALTALALAANLEPQSTGQSQDLTPWTLLTNLTLSNYLIYPQVVLIPVAWTMIVEVLFYLMLLGVLPVLRRSVWMAIAIQLTFVWVVLLSRSELNESWSLFAVNVSYLPLLITGQIVWAVTSSRIPLWTGGVFGVVAWLLYVYADVIDVGRIDQSYNLAAGIAALFFLLGYFAEPKLRQRAIWTAFSERTYSIYLSHSLALFVAFGLVRPHLPVGLAVVVSLVAAAALAEACYRLAERPSHRLARRLSRSRPITGPPRKAVATASRRHPRPGPAGGRKPRDGLDEVGETSRAAAGTPQREPDNGRPRSEPADRGSQTGAVDGQRSRHGSIQDGEVRRPGSSGEAAPVAWAVDDESGSYSDAAAWAPSSPSPALDVPGPDPVDDQSRPGQRGPQPPRGPADGTARRAEPGAVPRPEASERDGSRRRRRSVDVAPSASQPRLSVRDVLARVNGSANRSDGGDGSGDSVVAGDGHDGDEHGSGRLRGDLLQEAWAACGADDGGEFSDGERELVDPDEAGEREIGQGCRSVDRDQHTREIPRVSRRPQRPSRES